MFRQGLSFLLAFNQALRLSASTKEGQAMSSMTSTNVHDVASIELEEIKPLEGHGYTRQFTAKDRDGGKFHVVVFADKREELLLSGEA